MKKTATKYTLNSKGIKLKCPVKLQRVVKPDNSSKTSDSYKINNFTDRDSLCKISEAIVIRHLVLGSAVELSNGLTHHSGTWVEEGTLENSYTELYKSSLVVLSCKPFMNEAGSKFTYYY